MSIGRLFAGYVVTKPGFPRFANRGVAPKAFMAAGLTGALLIFAGNGMIPLRLDRI